MSRKALVIAMAIAAIAALFTGVMADHDNPVDTGAFDAAPAGNLLCSGVSTTKFGPDMDCPTSPAAGDCDRSDEYICDRYTWEYDNYVYLEEDGMPYLPAPFTGIPRVDISTNEEFKGQMDFSSAYMGAIAGQLLPGLVIAVLLFLSMILCLFSLCSSMSANLLDQTKEIGILRAMGFTKRRITMLYLYEAFVLVLASSLLGVMIGVIVAFTMTLQRVVFTGIPIFFVFPWT